MTPKSTAVAAYYARLKAAGGSRHTFALSPSVSLRLVQLCAIRGVSKQRLVADLVMAAELPTVSQG